MDTSQPLITVVIGTYRRAEHLDRAIRSVLDQPGNFWNLLIGDDGSPDHTAEVIARYTADRRVSHYRNEMNLGMQENMLKVVRLAIGRYVFILTDDDYLQPNALERTRQMIESHPDAGYFLSHLPTLDERSGRIVHWHRVFAQTQVQQNSLQGMANVVGAAWVLSRQVLRYDLIDWDTWEKFKMNIFFPVITAGRLLLNAPMVYLAEPLVMHTQFNEVFWHKFGRDELDIQFNLDLDGQRCMRAILHDYQATPEVQNIIKQWEHASFRTYLFREDKGFYDLAQTLGLRLALNKLVIAFQPNFQQRMELIGWFLLIPGFRLWLGIKQLLRRLSPDLISMVRRLKHSGTLMRS